MSNPVQCSLPALSGLAAGLLAVGLVACGEAPPTIERIRAGGELRVATLISGTTYYDGAHGTTGFEHDLAHAFAASLGLDVRFVIARDYRELRELLADNKAHLAAALTPIGARVEEGMRYGPTYAIARQLVVYRRGRETLQTATDLRGRSGAAIAGRGAAALLERELPKRDGYTWQLREDSVVEDLLQDVNDGVLAYAVVPSFDFEAARAYYPELAEAFTLGSPQAVAWLFRRGRDDSLWQAQLAFFSALRESGEFTRIHTRHFGRHGDFDYVESRALLRHYEERLPAFRDDFIAMGAETAIDWLLLAAMAYQESRWQADARSPTGVRGLMMLTKRTADMFAVDRLDGRDSIEGGARYLAQIKQGLPARIAEPDRTWLALAAYNIGHAHLEDARVLAARAGADPDRWSEVRRHLPKLAKRTWARKTRYGYARGHQAVQFVENTRRFYDVLRWLEAESTPAAQTEVTPVPKLVSPVL